MPTLISADRWEFDPDRLPTGLSPNHGQELSTDAILKKMDEIEARPEIAEMDRKLMESLYYLRGKASG